VKVNVHDRAGVGVIRIAEPVAHVHAIVFVGRDLEARSNDLCARHCLRKRGEVAGCETKNKKYQQRMVVGRSVTRHGCKQIARDVAEEQARKRVANGRLSPHMLDDGLDEGQHCDIQSNQQTTNDGEQTRTDEHDRHRRTPQIRDDCPHSRVHLAARRRRRRE